MNPELLLRIASGLMLFHAFGHMMGMRGWKKRPDPKMKEVVDQMVANKAPFMGAVRSLADYYEGFGHAATISLLLIVALLWLVSGEAASNPQLSIKVLWPVAAFCILMGIDELIYFFPMAAAFSLISGVLTIVAIVKL